MEMMEMLERQDPLYQPGNFWKEASKDMLEEMSLHGVESFRSLTTSQHFFAPTYGVPGSGLTEEQIGSIKEALEESSPTNKQRNHFNHLLSGYSSALADYRVLQASEYRSESVVDLLKFSESSVGCPKEQFEFNGNRYSRSALNYLLGLSFLKKHVDLSEIESVMEIGGGFGTLGEIVHQVMPKAKYIDIDIPPTLCCSVYYLKEVVGEDGMSTAEDVDGLKKINIEKLNKVSVLPSWEIEQIEGKIDLFVNFISFQEMEPEIVTNYLQQVVRLDADWVMLRNMREGKQLSTEHRIGVDNPVYSEDYVGMLPNYQLASKNVWPYGFKTVGGFHSEIMLFRKK